MYQVPWDYKTVLNAAESGHMDVLRWCNSNGHERVDITGYVAADRDDIGMLTWCRDVGIIFQRAHARKTPGHRCYGVAAG